MAFTAYANRRPVALGAPDRRGHAWPGLPRALDGSWGRNHRDWAPSREMPLRSVAHQRVVSIGESFHRDGPKTKVSDKGVFCIRSLRFFVVFLIGLRQLGHLSRLITVQLD